MPSRLSKFTIGQRVRVTQGHSLLLGRTGVVACSLKYSIKGAHWVDMDQEPPSELRNYPLDDPFERSKYVLLWPRDCCAADP